jgi:hypothetical protein
LEQKSTETFQVTPWEVKGNIDYDKLVKDFGVQPISIDALPKVFQKEVLFRRGFVFAHRGFGNIITAIEHKKPFVMMTGLMPTGKFHIGHMLLAQQMVFYQKLGAKIYIAVADIQAKCDEKLGAMPASVKPWKAVVGAKNKEELLSTYFSDLKKTSSLGAELAVKYANRSKEIGLQLVADKVAYNENDVNTVLLTGFFHAYGPINNYLT